MQLRRLPARVAGLVLALVAALGLVVLNEIAHRQAEEALERVDIAAKSRAALFRLTQKLLVIETSARGYGLTGDIRQLPLIEQAALDLDRPLAELRALSPRGGPSADTLARLESDLRQHVAQARSRIQTAPPDLMADGTAWLGQVRTTADDARQQPADIQQQLAALVEEASGHLASQQRAVDQALWRARAGIPLAVAFALAAGALYLRQAGALARSRERAQLALQSERDRLDALVRDRTASLAELASHLQQVREDERAHLANELHDELGALMTAARLDVARLSRRFEPLPPEAATLFAHLQRTLGEGIALKRRIIEDLRPSSLAVLGLAPALEILAREFAERSGLDVESQVDAPALDAATQLTVFRLVQESLTNVARHARARRVDITLRPLPGQVEVSVADDGLGFTPGAPGHARHGLAGMRHRAEAAGGRLEVISRPGRGTRIRATLPAGPVTA